MISAVCDWNTFSRARVPNEWLVRDSQGNPVEIYGGAQFVDITNYCPPSSEYNNKKYNEYLAEFMAESADLDVYDGVMSHGVWDYPYGTTDVDLDRNGVNDWDEHGREWLENTWLDGVDKVVKGIRERIGNDKILVLNSGRFHEFNWEETNGLLLENNPCIWSFRNWRTLWNSWIRTAMEPHVLFNDAIGDKKTDYDNMRFQLAATMYGDGYFSFSERESMHHRYDGYYDEYDLDLGYPRGSMVQLFETGANDRGVYVRFFDKGAVILNVDDVDHHVTDLDIRDVSGYNGPYYRFRGGQVPSYNNGQIFTEITLTGRTYKDKGIIGDAIFLVKQPTTVVTDIFIDSDDEGTSPGSEPAQYVGDWQQVIHDIEDYWAMFVRKDMDMYGLAYSLPGDGSNTATFAPTIGVPGSYRVYEWHGDLTLAQEASDVPYEIHHANGTAFGVIDQTKDYGKWNYLGTYNFDVGTDGYVKISNNANGIVVADAFKFVYDESGGDVDNIPPNPPKNLRSESETENTITLAWERPNQASDGDYASSYQIMRSGTVLGYTFYQTYTDTGLVENTTYTYSIYALDDYGNLSTSPVTGQFTTSNDQTPPTVDSVKALNSSLVSIIFSEPVELSSAENANNYSINNNIIISSASLLNDNKTVQLTTSKHSVGVTYTITVNNVYDRASVPNVIAPNTTVNYNGVGDPIIISLSADNNYELYVNGEFLGSDTRWQEAESYYYIPQQLGKTVIAVKCWDNITTGGFVAEITFENNKFVTNESWKVSTVEEAGWKTLTFNDQLWEQATSYGLHGEAEPWAQYGNVQGISTDAGVKWIWSSDNQNDKVVYFRFTINEGPDQTPPAPPTGIIVVEPQK